jgi:hypothetical protein
MIRFRFRIRALMLAVLAVALALASLRLLVGMEDPARAIAAVLLAFLGWPAMTIVAAMGVDWFCEDGRPG